MAELATCDKLLVMAPGGAVAYFGPPEEALNFFGYGTWADVFSAFENYRDYDWAGRWKGSQHYQMYAAAQWIRGMQSGTDWTICPAQNGRVVLLLPFVRDVRPMCGLTSASHLSHC
ncbi:hypothetical protein SVIOM342S_00786 [Streptomyces violaceorubidus]